MDADEVRMPSLPMESTYVMESAFRRVEFRYEELELMTQGFNKNIGKGGFGEVFKGSFIHDDELFEVAVKKVMAEDGDEVEEVQFLREMATISGLQHNNLTSFLGYCYDKSKQYRYLVYKFMRNGSLDKWTFNPKERLPWNASYQIAIDVARGLEYLHHGCRHKILHLDIKPENILIGDDFRGRISDFGLSRLMERDKQTIKITPRGTPYYMGPEYLLFESDSYNKPTGNISEKADIYSFGMMLFEIVRGVRNDVPYKTRETGPESFFPTVVSQMISKRIITEFVDERLLELGHVDEVEVRVLLHIALCCVQEIPDDRPSMEAIVGMLESRDVPALPPEPRMLVLTCLCKPIEVFEKLIDAQAMEWPVCDARTISTLSWLVQQRQKFRERKEKDDSAKTTTESIRESARYSMDMTSLFRLPREFTYEQIRGATRNFRHSVCPRMPRHFNGTLDGEGKVIVKLIEPEYFDRTIAFMTGLQHFSLVPFLGYCVRNASVVYDCMPNSSLDQWIFQGDSDPKKYLTWAQRYAVAKDIYSVLHYLVYNCSSMMVCPDDAVQAENIWLDVNFRALLMDYDSSLCYPRDWVRSRNFVFRPYAMLVLELVTGRRRYHLLQEFPGLNSCDPAKHLWATLEIKKNMVDKRLCGLEDFDEQQLVALLNLVLSLINRYGEDMLMDFKEYMTAARCRKRTTSDGRSPADQNCVSRIHDGCVPPLMVVPTFSQAREWPTRAKRREQSISTDIAFDELGNLAILEGAQEIAARIGKEHDHAKLSKNVKRTDRPVSDARTISNPSWLVQWWQKLRGRKEKDDVSEAIMGSIREDVKDAMRATSLSILPKEFTYEEIRGATSNFKRPICPRMPHHFKGTLDGVGDIVVKLIKPECFGGTVAVMAGLQHSNLVPFRGYCENNASVVYDCVPNIGSLDHWIFKGNDGPNKCLTWAQRYAVAKDMYSVLHYLVYDCSSMMVCPDDTVQAENIWLDVDFRAVLMDYDSSLCYSRDWVCSRHFVFRPFAMLLLELITGRRRSYLLENFPDLSSYDSTKQLWATLAIKRDMVDGRLSKLGGFDEQQLVTLVNLVLSLLNRHGEDMLMDFEGHKVAAHRMKRRLSSYGRPPADQNYAPPTSDGQMPSFFQAREWPTLAKRREQSISTDIGSGGSGDFTKPFMDQ